MWRYFVLLFAGALWAEQANLYLQLGHSGMIMSAAFSPDERFLLTGSEDNTARLWDLASGAELRRFVGHTDKVHSVAFSSDERFVLTGSGDDTARLWASATGMELRRFKGHSGEVFSVALSLDERFVLTGSDDKSARLWDLASGKELRRFVGHSGSVTSVTFSPDARSVLTGSYDKTARLWDVATGTELRRFVGHSDWVTSVAFSPDGHYVLTGGHDKTARLWNAATGSEVRRFEGHSEGISLVAFSLNGRVVMTNGDDKTARMWDISTGAELHRFEGHSENDSSVTFSPKGRLVLICNFDGGAQLWDAPSGAELRRFEGHSKAVTSETFSPDGRFVLTGSEDNTARLWDLANGAELRRFAGHSDQVTSVAFSPDGRFVLTGSDDRTARLWDAASGKELRRFTGHSERVLSVAFSPDGRRVLTGSWDKTARLWDVSTGAELRRLVGHFSAVQPVTFSADGTFLLTNSWNTIRLWDASSGAELRRFVSPSEYDQLTSAALSPDGRFLLAAAFFEARLLNATTGTMVRRFQAGHFDPTGNDSVYVRSVAFSPDGRFILTGADDKTARLWDASTGAEVRRFEGHFDSVSSATFSPDGRFVLTTSNDLTTRLWNASTGKQLATLVSSREGGWAVVDPDGRYDASDPDNASGLHFVAGFDVIGLGQLKQRFYTPHLLARIWRGESLPSLAGLNNVKLVPGIQVNAPTADSSDLTVRLTNRGGGIGRVIVKVNGRELPTAARGATPDPNAKSAEFKLNLAGATLSPTGNTIEVFAENGDGVIRSRGVVTSWQREGPKQTPQPNLFAIVVGVSSYDNESLNLRYSAKDAVDFGHALQIAADSLFGKERTHVTLLASGSGLEPTKENIRQAFDRVSKDAQGSDLLVVYLAGHGVAARSEQDQYYYLTKEARSSDIDRDAGLRAVSAISSAELKEWLSRINMPLKQVVVLDTCAAGALVKLPDRRELSPDQIRAIELLKDSTGSWILMGSAADAVSYEANRYAQGLLTYALLQGMQGAALEEERVDVSKLFVFAQRRVEDLAKGIGGIQQPVLSAPKGQSFPIGLLTAEGRKQIHLSTLKPQLLRARVVDENDLDSLKLEPALRAKLRAASLPVTRGADRRDPQIVYLDSVVDEVPDALIPQIRYAVTGDKVKVRLRLLQNGNPVAEQNLELPKGDAHQLSGALLSAIVLASGRVK